jgi:hypothetical protein
VRNNNDNVKRTSARIGKTQLRNFKNHGKDP